MTKRAMGVVGAALVVAMFEMSAFAQPAPPAPPPPSGWEPEAPAGHDWSVTGSPIHLIVGPIIEVTVERRLGPKLGAALMLGVGKFTDKPSGGVETKYDVFEAGASMRAYLFGDFDKGVQIGGSIEYVKLSGDDVNGSGQSAIGNGMSLSPFIGYKHTWALGITFDSQFGPTLLLVRAESDTSTAEDSRFGINLNLNLGYSF